MIGACGTRLCSVILLASCLGCLDAPPSGTKDDGDTPDATPSMPDGGPCPALVGPPFNDTAQWLPVEPETSSVVAGAQQVELMVTDEAGADAYADLHSLVAAGIEGTTLTATLTVSTATAAWAGISWHASGDVLDYYDLAVREGVLYARFKAEDGDATDTCAGTCPPYNPDDPPMLRLQAVDGVVHYQTSSDGSDWVDIGTAEVRGLDYTALLFGTTEPFGSASMTVSAAEWVDCVL